MKPNADTIRVFKEMQENLTRMGKGVAQLMRHPDATPDQLWATHKTYTDGWKSYKDVRAKLREKFPETGLMRVYPWNMREKEELT